MYSLNSYFLKKKISKPSKPGDSGQGTRLPYTFLINCEMPEITISQVLLLTIQFTAMNI